MLSQKGVVGRQNISSKESTPSHEYPAQETEAGVYVQSHERRKEFGGGRKERGEGKHLHNSTSKCLLRPRTRINAKPAAPPRVASLPSELGSQITAAEIRLIPGEGTNERSERLWNGWRIGEEGAEGAKPPKRAKAVRLSGRARGLKSTTTTTS